MNYNFQHLSDKEIFDLIVNVISLVNASLKPIDTKEEKEKFAHFFMDQIIPMSYREIPDKYADYRDYRD